MPGFVLWRDGFCAGFVDVPRKGRLRIGDILRVGPYRLEFCQKSPGPHSLTESLPSKQRRIEILGDSTPWQQTLAACKRAAQTSLPVLLLGETGTGKELLAQYLHRQSSRSCLTFMTLNCAALTPSLIESELFGYERGAFTGATQQQPGVFESTGEGTLFLDEIGELPLDLQPKLLRTLEEKTIRRIGSSREISVQARIVTATNQDLTRLVSCGRFRADLFHRLHILPIRVPALRERVDDIPTLAEFFLQNSGFNLELTEHTVHQLQQYSWPGNVRELRNVLTRAAVFAVRNDPKVDDTATPRQLDDLAPFFGHPGASPPLRPPQHSRALSELNVQTLDFHEREHIYQQLQFHRWHRQKTASSLGISRSTLYMKMKKYDLV